MTDEKKATYRGFTEAQARAHKKYISQFVEIKIRVEPERRDSIRDAAAAARESVNVYINRAIDQRMSAAAAFSLPLEALERARRGAKATGETAEAFVVRAVDGQIKRDSGALALGINPANKGGENTSV